MKNTTGATDHIKNHQKYPATKAELVAECDGLSDFSAEDKTWFMDHLTKESYQSADDLLQDLGMAEA